MPGFTDAYELTVLDHIFRNQSLTPPATMYVGYSKSAGTESTDANYVRQAITFAAANAGAIVSSGAVTFPAVAASDSVVENALFSAATAGTQMTDWKALTGGTISLAIGQQYRIPAGSYTVTLD
jgi:hypothetical protein